MTLGGLTLDFVQLVQAAAQVLPLLGVHAGDFPVQGLVPAALDVVLNLLMELLAVPARPVHGLLAALDQDLAQLPGLLGHQDHGTNAGIGHVYQCLT